MALQLLGAGTWTIPCTCLKGASLSLQMSQAVGQVFLLSPAGCCLLLDWLWQAQVMVLDGMPGDWVPMLWKCLVVASKNDKIQRKWTLKLRPWKSSCADKSRLDAEMSGSINRVKSWSRDRDRELIDDNHLDSLEGWSHCQRVSLTTNCDTQISEALRSS
jgi:hypothetical protein